MKQPSLKYQWKKRRSMTELLVNGDYSGLETRACYQEQGMYDHIRERQDQILRACNAHEALLAACKEFVRKVDCGEAKSVRSYEQMKAAIALAEAGQ